MSQMPERQTTQRVALACIALGVLARLLPHPPNVTPVTALALFGGAVLSRRWAFAVPLVMIVISDMILGLHDVLVFTWSSSVITVLFGLWIRQRPGARRIAAAAVASSTIFFVITNFGVWLVGAHGTMYPKTLQGLWLCYVAALPFYRNALIGDLVTSLGLFGLYAWATSRVGMPRVAPSTSSAPHAG